MSDYRTLQIAIEGYSVSALESGNPGGLPVIALHGWLDNAASFKALDEFLSGIRLISLDLIGHGKSSHRPSGMPYHIWDNVTDLEAIISSLGLDQVNLIGHSMGASIAMLFAGAFPGRVNRLMCIEGLAPLSYPVQELPQLFASALVKRSKMSSRTLKPYSNREAALAARMNGRWPVGREAAENLLERGLVRTTDGFTWSHDPKLMMPSLVRFSPEQIRSFIRSVKAKTVVIKASGGADHLIDEWIDDLENAELKEMSGGHHLHMEPQIAKDIATIINSWVM
ncbi:MAG: alpha/beta fold hydrolase [Neptuniibacter sp.]